MMSAVIGVQVLHRHGSEIRESDVADDWRRPDMLFVGPLTQELDVNCLSWFRPSGLVCCTARMATFLDRAVALGS